MNLGENCGSLVEYLKAFDVTLRVMQTEEALTRVAYELAEDAARENVRYMEVRYAPMLHTRRGLKLTTRRRGGARRASRAAQDEFGIESNVIICGIRNVSPESSLEMAELAVAYKNRGVVGFDLAGAEYDHPAKHHRARVPARPRQQHQRHHPRRRGVRPRVDRAGDPRVRRASHRPRLPPARGRRPAPLRQRPPHPARVLPVVERADRRGARSREPPAQALLQPRPARDGQHRQPPRHRHHRLEGALALSHADGPRARATSSRSSLSGFKSAFLPFHVKQQYLRTVSEELKSFTDDELPDRTVAPSAN